MKQKKFSWIILILVVIVLIGVIIIKERPQIPPLTTTSIPVTTTIEIAQQFIQSCEGKDFEIDPDIEYQLSTTKIDLNDSIQILGHIDVAARTTIIDIHAHTYGIVGSKVEEIKNYDKRKLLVTAKPVESDFINEIEVIDYEVIPYSVLTGKLSIKNITSRGVTTEWLILSTFVNGKEYNFQLMPNYKLRPAGVDIEYLRKNYVGVEVTVSGVICPMSYTGYQTFYLNSICESIE